MYAGIVAGSVVATVKQPGLENIPLLIVQKIENGKEPDLIVAADQTGQAGPGDHGYMIGSKEAARIFRRPRARADRPLATSSLRPPADSQAQQAIDRPATSAAARGVAADRS